MKTFVLTCCGEERELLVPKDARHDDLLYAIQSLFRDELRPHAELDFKAGGKPIVLSSKLPNNQRMDVIPTGALAVPPDKVIHVHDGRDEEPVAPCTLRMPWYVTVGQVRRMLDCVRPDWLKLSPLPGDEFPRARCARLDTVHRGTVHRERVWTLASHEELPDLGSVHLIIREEDGTKWYKHDGQKRVPPPGPVVSFTITVKDLSGKRVVLTVASDCTIDNLKARIQDKQGIPPDQQRIIHQGEMLGDDSRTLCEYDVGAGAVLDLVLRLRGC